MFGKAKVLNHLKVDPVLKLNKMSDRKLRKHFLDYRVMLRITRETQFFFYLKKPYSYRVIEQVSDKLTYDLLS